MASSSAPGSVIPLPAASKECMLWGKRRGRKSNKGFCEGLGPRWHSPTCPTYITTDGMSSRAPETLFQHRDPPWQCAQNMSAAPNFLQISLHVQNQNHVQTCTALIAPIPSFTEQSKLPLGAFGSNLQGICWVLPRLSQIAGGCKLPFWMLSVTRRNPQDAFKPRDF